jgi:transcriptional regulator with XRE-family HTH domain
MTKLRQILKEKDRTISYLVKKTGISRYSLDLIANGEKYPTTREAELIADALGVSVVDLFFNPKTITIKSESK